MQRVGVIPVPFCRSFFFPFPFGKPDNVLRGDLEFDLRPKVKNAFSLTKPLHHDGTGFHREQTDLGTLLPWTWLWIPCPCPAEGHDTELFIGNPVDHRGLQLVLGCWDGRRITNSF